MPGLLLGLSTASANAGSLQGANGADGTNSTALVYGTGGAGGGNAGSGGVSGSDAPTPGAGIAGSGGAGGGGGGGGGGGNGAAGGESEYGLGGKGGTIARPAGGGGVEAGGGGGFGASAGASGGGGGGGGGQRGLNLTTTDGSIALGDSVGGGAGGAGGFGFGNTYADGGGGGGGGIGVVFGGSGILSVDGSIAGGAGGHGGDGDKTKGAGSGNQVIGSYAGSGGVGGTGLVVSSANAAVYVNGAITGGNGGAAGIGQNVPVISKGGVGGVGMIGAGIAVILGPDGSISGGLGGDGITRANAIDFGSGANSFELQADGSSVVGKVVANGTDDVFRLGGKSAGKSFDTALLGTQYTGFERFEKLGAGTWTLTGSPGVSTAWLVSEGTLALPGAMTTDIETSGSGRFALQGGTLSGRLDNAGTTNAHGEITGAISNTATGSFNLDGDLVAGGGISNTGLFTAYGAGTVGRFAVSGGAGFSNAGTISLSQPGGIAGDVLDLRSARLFEGGTNGQLALDIDLSSSAAGKSDQLLLGASSGALQVSFNPDPSRYGALTAGVLVIETADGGLAATARGLKDRGLVSYGFEQIGTNWYVTSALNAAPLGGIVAGMETIVGLTDIASRPVALDAESCAAGLYSKVTGGTRGATAATAASNGDAAQSAVGAGFGGAQFALDFGCLDLGAADTTLRLGLLGGFTTGNATHEQALSGGTLLQSHTDFDTGYAGIYGQLRSGGLIVDGRLGYDSTAFELSADISGGVGRVIDGQHTTTRRFSASGSIGYGFALAEVTVTPTVGFSYARAETGAIQLVDLGGRLVLADHDTATAFTGIEIGARTALADGAVLRSFASGTLHQTLTGGRGFSYSDDINGTTDLSTTLAATRATLGAGLSYESMAATVGVAGELNYWDGQVGAGVTLRAGVSF